MYTSKTGASRQRPAYVPALSSFSLPLSPPSSHSSSSLASYTRFERESTFTYVPKQPSTPVQIGVVHPSSLVTHTVELPQSFSTMSMFERGNVATHAIAFVVVLVYLSVRHLFPGVPSSSTATLFSTLWSVHILTTVISSLTFLFSTVYHCTPTPRWWFIRVLRSTDIAFVILATATSLFANTCVALAAFWTHLIVYADTVSSLECKPTVWKFVAFNWRTLFDGLIAGVFTAMYSFICLNSTDRQQSVEFFGSLYSEKRDTRRWGIGDHHFVFQRVCCVMALLLGWIIIAPLEVLYIPDNFGVVVVCSRVVGSTFVVLSSLLDSYESIDRAAGAAPCAWIDAYVPFSHTVWHVVSFVAVFADILIRDHAIVLITKMYDTQFGNEEIVWNVC
jgi:hypothetical protein